jgi:hypothetical protein
MGNKNIEVVEVFAFNYRKWSLDAIKHDQVMLVPLSRDGEIRMLFCKSGPKAVAQIELGFAARGDPGSLEVVISSRHHRVQRSGN